MMPGARFLFYSTAYPFILLVGRKREQLTISYEGPLFSPSSPRPFCC